jgi:transcriptional regulator with PAS, ATPase and Fis domain
MEVREVNWTTGFQGAITVCDLHGIVVEMNERSAEMFKKNGGRDLIGKSLFDCHPEPSRTKLHRLLETGESNIYTIEKNGTKKLVYQVPWHQNGQRMGMVEMVLEIPLNPPHFVRQ